jgi:hypothetical protein
MKQNIKLQREEGVTCISACRMTIKTPPGLPFFPFVKDSNF